LREPELIEPLLSSARSCLEHRHAYVRKNAVWAVASIFQHSESLIPDAPELLQTFLESETDSTCKRNAFAALMSISHQKALEYLRTTFDTIPNTDELLQLAELEFLRKDAVQNTQNKVGFKTTRSTVGQVANYLQSRYLKLMLELLDAPTSTVVYEAATSLTALTSNPVAVKAAAGKLIELAIREADNNVKLIVLDRVDQLRTRNEGALDDLTMEILRVLNSPDIDVRRKALGIALEMVSSKNVEEIVMLLKKELAKTVDEQYEQVGFHASSWTSHDLTVCTEQRIPPALGPVNTHLRHQVLRDRRERCRPFDGFHRRLQQQLCRGRDFICQGSC